MAATMRPLRSWSRRQEKNSSGWVTVQGAPLAMRAGSRPASTNWRRFASTRSILARPFRSVRSGNQRANCAATSGAYFIALAAHSGTDGGREVRRAASVSLRHRLDCLLDDRGSGAAPSGMHGRNRTVLLRRRSGRARNPRCAH